MGSTILVTGATGTVGSFLVRKLGAAGVRARALVRSRDKAEAVESLGLEAAVGDLDKPLTLAPALAGVERVFLLSAPEERQAELQNNLVRAARDAGVRHVVKLSAIGVGGELDAISLGRVHRETEEEIERAGFAYTHLRPNGFMQNSFMFAPSIKSQGAFYAPYGDAEVSYVDARDVASVAFHALTEDGHEGKAYEITGPQSLSYHDLARELSAALGREVRYVEVPIEAARAAMVGSGMQEWTADTLVELFDFYRDGRADRVRDTVREVTGRDPITFAQFARDHAQAFQ
ncbi:MAG TPA: SDR family oxidoreductase [Pyrinomonadaceae bacterium]|nr:SDR family oxidoreductase [Pyrinomonadaceae bacterium]